MAPELQGHGTPRGGEPGREWDKPREGATLWSAVPTEGEEGMVDGCGHPAGPGAGRGKGADCLGRFSWIYL